MVSNVCRIILEIAFTACCVAMGATFILCLIGVILDTIKDWKKDK